jgi:hypothetical protein
MNLAQKTEQKQLKLCSVKETEKKTLFYRKLAAHSPPAPCAALTFCRSPSARLKHGPRPACPRASLRCPSDDDPTAQRDCRQIKTVPDRVSWQTLAPLCLSPLALFCTPVAAGGARRGDGGWRGPSPPPVGPATATRAAAAVTPFHLSRTQRW